MARGERNDCEGLRNSYNPISEIPRPMVHLNNNSLYSIYEGRN